MKIKVTKHSEMLSMIFRVFSQLSGVSSFLDFRVGSCSNIVLSIHCVIVRPEADLMLHVSQSVTPVKNRCPPSPDLCSATCFLILYSHLSPWLQTPAGISWRKRPVSPPPRACRRPRSQRSSPGPRPPARGSSPGNPSPAVPPPAL